MHWSLNNTLNPIRDMLWITTQWYTPWLIWNPFFPIIAHGLQLTKLGQPNWSIRWHTLDWWILLDGNSREHPRSQPSTFDWSKGLLGQSKFPLVLSQSVDRWFSVAILESSQAFFQSRAFGWQITLIGWPIKNPRLQFLRAHHLIFLTVLVDEQDLIAHQG